MPFQPSLMFVSKTRAYPSGALFKVTLMVLTTNVRLGRLETL